MGQKFTANRAPIEMLIEWTACYNPPTLWRAAERRNDCEGQAMKDGWAIIAFLVGGLWFLFTALMFAADPRLIRDNLVSMVVLPGSLIALGVHLWKKAHPETVIDAEIVDDPPTSKY